MEQESLLESLHEDFPLLASSLHPKLDDDTSIELVLRDRFSCSFGDMLRSIEQLGETQVSNLTSVFLYKDFVAELTLAQQTQFYETLGRALGNQLEEFSLSFIRIPAASLASLLRRMPRLQKLYLGRVCLLHKQQAPQLYSVLRSGLKQLHDFHCSLAPALPSHQPMFQTETDTLDELLESVAQLPSLQTFYLSAPIGRGHIQTTTCLQALSHSSIQDLTLMNCPLRTTQHIQALLHRGKKSFTCLSLMNAGIGDVGATVIVQRGLPGLQKLYLPGNRLTDLAGYALTKALRTFHNSLKVLDLHDNRLTAKFAHCMGKTLEYSHCQLQFLDVSYNPLLDAGGIALASALIHNKTLQVLNLFQNQISDQTCKALATALESNRSLKQLNLYHNPKIKTVDALLHNLEHNNYVLERLEVQTPSQQHASLEFWLTLNRKFGRKNLLGGNTSDGQYLDKGLGQASQANDLNSLFYFLKAKPALCNTTTTANSGAKRSLSQVTAEACQILVASEEF